MRGFWSLVTLKATAICLSNEISNEALIQINFDPDLGQRWNEF